MIVFENSGEIDPRLITLIGVNVKETDSPIGHFGTGLKYAISCLSRWEETIIIQSGKNEFSFGMEETIIRGKTFQLISMFSKFDHIQLGFTTEYGKNWEPWMVYRELWCNAKDELGGRVYQTNIQPVASEGITRIIVDGERIQQAHFNKNAFILSSDENLLTKVGGIEIFEGMSESIFYRGISVQKMTKPSLYTYNITKQLYLTEDRTSSSWTTNPIIADGLSQLIDEEIIVNTLTADADKMESGLDYCYVSSASEIWKRKANELLDSKLLEIPASVRNLISPPTAASNKCPTCGQII